MCELGTLWLDVKEIKKKLIYHVKVIFFRPENKISNSAKVFLVSFYFIIIFCTKKLMVPQVPEVLEVPQSVDPLFCNTRI